MNMDLMVADSKENIKMTTCFSTCMDLCRAAGNSGISNCSEEAVICKKSRAASQQLHLKKINLLIVTEIRK